MTNRIDRLEERGFVARRADPDDRRSVIVRLTAKGRRAIDDAIGVRLDAARTALAQPEPEGPTVMEIIALADEIEAEGLGQVDLVRRALTRWGRPITPTTETP